MKKSILIISLLVTLLFLVSCAPKVTDKELGVAMENFSEEQLDEVIQEVESDQSLVGEALGKPFLKRFSFPPEFSTVSKNRFKAVAVRAKESCAIASLPCKSMVDCGITNIGCGKTRFCGDCGDYSLTGKTCVNNKCQQTECGDGVSVGNEACDDGNTDRGDGCDDKCNVEKCGNGLKQDWLGEKCDDGNTLDKDGCSSACKEELGFVCEGNKPTVCKQCSQILPGLISWWPADGNADDFKGDEDGIILSDLQFSKGKLGQAFDFSKGGSVYVSSPDLLNFGELKKFSIEVWFKTTNPKGGVILSKVGMSSNPKYNSGYQLSLINKWDLKFKLVKLLGAVGDSEKITEIIARKTKPQEQEIKKDGGCSDGYIPNEDKSKCISVYSDVIEGIPLNDGKWHHVVVIFNPSVCGNVLQDTLQIYIDGDILSTLTEGRKYDRVGTTCLDSSNTGHLSIGSSFGSNSIMEGVSDFDGQIDQVGIYNYALSEKLVQNLFKDADQEQPRCLS